MRTNSAVRTPAKFSAGWRLERVRSNEFGYQDIPIEGGVAADVARTLPVALKRQLAAVNMRSINPVELSRLSGRLHHMGYLSHDAWSQLGEFQIDYRSPIDPTALTKEALRTLRGVDDAKYALAIRQYEAGIAAAQSLTELTDYLRNHLVDLHA